AALPGGNQIAQSSYLVGARRSWHKSRVRPYLGFAVYTVEADGPAHARDARDGDDMSGDLALGRLDGYLLDFSMRPTERSRIEFKRETSMLAYDLQGASHFDERWTSSRIRYSHAFSNCMQLHGRYSATDDASQFDLSISKDRWNVNLSRLEGSDSSPAIHIGYRIPLDGGNRRARDCGSSSYDAPPAFEPIVDAAMTRPHQFPRSALAITD